MTDTGASNHGEGNRFRFRVWLIWTLIISSGFIYLTGRNLANYYPVSSDDVWIMSASYKLATEGIFGSDIYAGFFNADKHYFIALPVHHMLQALSFRIFGAGIVQARYPALFSSIFILWVTSWLAYRWFGLGESMLTSTLLFVWRSNLIASEPRTPLLTMGQSGRYDALAVALVWLSILVLYHLLRNPSRPLAFALGIATGLAALTQFFGGFSVLIVAICLFTSFRTQPRKGKHLGWFTIGFLLVLVPYFVYLIPHQTDFYGQAFLKGNRLRFGDPDFYLSNLRRELTRYAWMIDQPFPDFRKPKNAGAPLSPWIFVIGFFPSFLYLAWRAYRKRENGPTMLLISIIGLLGGLAVFDQTKAPLYSIALLPSLVMAHAVLLIEGIKFYDRMGFWPARIVPPMVSLFLIFVMIDDGIEGFNIHLERSRDVSPYQEVGLHIAGYLPSDASVIGAERWWWALRDYPYLAMNGLFARWQIAKQAQTEDLPFQQFLPPGGNTFLIVNNNVRGDIRMFSPQIQDQFWNFLDRCATTIADWQDGTYGRIEIYSLEDCRLP